MTLRACGKNPVHMGSAAVRAQLVIAAYRTGTELIEDVIGLSQLKPGGIHPANAPVPASGNNIRSEEHTSELQSLMRISYAVFCLKKKKKKSRPPKEHTQHTKKRNKLNKTINQH